MPAKPVMNRQAFFVAIFLAVACLSVVGRAHLLKTRPTTGRLDGQEPESHILVTNIAFTEIPASVHHFLPIFNLGPRYNKFINQHVGASSPDAEGNYFYCSTPPL